MTTHPGLAILEENSSWRIALEKFHDALIIGSGMAGLRAAVELAQETHVAVVSKVFPTRSHSGAAQGGITAALGNEEQDDWEWHMFDTVKGSDYLADQDAVEIMVRDAPRAILELEHMGVPFSRNHRGLIAQRAFGGHTRDFGKAPVKRACYASDRTGRVIVDTLYEQCLKMGVVFYPEFLLLDLIFQQKRCVGAWLLDISRGEALRVWAKSVLIATGGAGRLFRTTSNCSGNTGDGLAVVLCHGIPLQDMEFVQFHPTGLRGVGILLSEAARGEGGVLRNGLGERFMARYAPQILDLAPRDIVSRAILKEIREGRGVEGQPYVHLDLTGLGEKRIKERLWEVASFARIYGGVDASLEPIPVEPTCHYFMGGIPTDPDGRVLGDGKQSPVQGLFAAGECACVSVHGANRLGCNSLLDLVVFGRRAAKAMAEWIKEAPDLPPQDMAEPHKPERLQRLLQARGPERVPGIRQDLQSLLMDHCSVFRDGKGLVAALEGVLELQQRFRRLGLEGGGRSFDLEVVEALELEHMLVVARVLVESALCREESRGAHFREDHPQRNDGLFLKHTLAFYNGQKVCIDWKPVKVTRFPPKERTY